MASKDSFNRRFARPASVDILRNDAHALFSAARRLVKTSSRDVGTNGIHPETMNGINRAGSLMQVCVIAVKSVPSLDPREGLLAVELRNYERAARSPCCRMGRL